MLEAQPGLTTALPCAWHVLPRSCWGLRAVLRAARRSQQPPRQWQQQPPRQQMDALLSHSPMQHQQQQLSQAEVATWPRGSVAARWPAWQQRRAAALPQHRAPPCTPAVVRASNDAVCLTTGAWQGNNLLTRTATAWVGAHAGHSHHNHDHACADDGTAQVRLWCCARVLAHAVMPGGCHVRCARPPAASLQVAHRHTPHQTRTPDQTCTRGPVYRCAGRFVARRTCSSCRSWCSRALPP